MVTFSPSRTPRLSPGRTGPTSRVHFSPGAQKKEAAIISPWEVATGTELDPQVVMAFGRRGDGKTLWVTTTMAMMLQRYIQRGQRPSERYPDGFKLATNYHVQFADFRNPMLVDMISSYDERMRRMVAGIDEMLSYVPSRRSSARVNVDWGNALVQIRKLDMEIASATQHPQNIDSQMLQQIDWFVMPILTNRRWIPERELWTHKLTGRMQYKPTSIRFLAWDWWGTFTGKQWSKRWPPQLSGEPPDVIEEYHNVHQLFSWFSTKEQVPSIWHRNRENVLVSQWEKELEEMAAEFVPEEMEESAAAAEGYKKAATLNDLIAAQPDDVIVATLLDQAQGVDPTIKSTRLLALRMEEAGFTIIKDGHAYRALRVEGK